MNEGLNLSKYKPLFLNLELLGDWIIISWYMVNNSLIVFIHYLSTSTDYLSSVISAYIWFLISFNYFWTICSTA